MNVVSHDHHENGAPPNKGIKSPSKLLSPKYQSQSSLGEQKPNETMKNDHNTIVEVEEEVGERLSGSETVIKEGESRDIERDNPSDKVCRDAKEVEEVGEWIEKGYPSNQKIPCMIGRKFIDNAYINLDSPVMDFTILENIEANINPSLSLVVFGWPFVEITKLILDREQGLITFMDGTKRVTYKTPYKDSEMDDLTSKGHDLLSSRVILSKDDYRRGYERANDLESGFYMDIDKLGPSYEE
ncbi:hypothetical protein Tco_0475553 [Tanacetum coccineum]